MSTYYFLYCRQCRKSAMAATTVGGSIVQPGVNNILLNFLEYHTQRKYVENPFVVDIPPHDFVLVSEHQLYSGDYPEGDITT